MAQSHLLRIQMKRLENSRTGEALDHRAISVKNIKTSCHFHHIDIDSLCSIPLGREAPSVQPNHSGRIEGRDTYV
jgi:hypothetical protein